MFKGVYVLLDTLKPDPRESANKCPSRAEVCDEHF